MSGFEQYPNAQEATGGFRQYASRYDFGFEIFKKLIIVGVGTWHTALELEASPKHELWSGKKGEREKGIAMFCVPAGHYTYIHSPGGVAKRR